MSRHPLTLSIPQPCHESWAQMTPASQGRHCAACAKVVVDFTVLSDAEVVALLHRTAAPCGRFRKDQLQRVLRPLAEPAPRWRTWLAATAAVLGLRELAAEPGASQQKAAVHNSTTESNHRIRRRQQPSSAAAAAAADEGIVRGRVIDQATGNGIPGVTALLWGTTIGASTNADGIFELALPPAYQQDMAAEIQLYFVGYVTKDVNVRQFQQSPAPVEMKMNVMELGGAVVIASGNSQKPWPLHPHTLWNRLRNAFQR